MKYYIIAGEASGDLHAANLVREIRLVDQNANIRGWGGDLMSGQGVNVVKHYRDLAFMGFTEVVMNLRTIFRNLESCKKDIVDFNPDAVILVDYPGFNLRIAEFTHQKGFKNFYYISPQVWAWKKSRVYRIREIIDKMMVILPFEKEFYKKYNYEVDFVGHPLLDAVEQFNFKTPLQDYLIEGKKIVALLPGSRKQEIKTMLPVMLDAMEGFKELQPIIAAAPAIDMSFYKEITGDAENIKIIQGKTYSILHNAYLALVTSGTATLETALFNVPEVVCYKGNQVSYQIARKLVDVKYISLVNLIMDKQVVTELIQHEMSSINIKAEIEKLCDELVREKMISDFIELKKLLGGSGASKRSASLIFNSLVKSSE